MNVPQVPSAASSASATDSQRSLPAQSLGQEEFIKLLITQMTTQDPLNPKKDTDFIAQMAQFSSLEQSRAMQQDMAQLRTEQQFLQANGLIGRTVQIQIDPETHAEGKVEAVRVMDGKPRIIVDGESYDLNQLLRISPALTIS
jgi:flagellar basal-body rod modification protein FlgD